MTDTHKNSQKNVSLDQNSQKDTRTEIENSKINNFLDKSVIKKKVQFAGDAKSDKKDSDNSSDEEGAGPEDDQNDLEKNSNEDDEENYGDEID